MKKHVPLHFAMAVLATALFSTPALAATPTDFTQYELGYTYNYPVFENGIAMVQYDTGCWFIDQQANQLFDTVYAYASDFSEGYAVVGDGTAYWYIDANGNPIHDTTFAHAEPFSEGYAVVGDGDVYWHIDTAGNDLYTQRYSLVSSFSDGAAAVELDDGSFSHIDTTGARLYAGSYKTVKDFSEGLAVATADDGTIMIIDKGGVGAVEVPENTVYVEPFSQGYACVVTKTEGTYSYDYNMVYIDTTGAVVWDDLYYSQTISTISRFSEGLCSMPVDGVLVGYVNTDGAVVIPGQYYFANPFQDGYAVAITFEGHYYVLDTQGTVVVDAGSHVIHNAGEGNFYETYDGERYLFNVTGESNMIIEDVLVSEVVDTPSAGLASEVYGAIDAGLVPQLTGSPLYADTITRLQFAELIVQMVETVTGEEITPADSETFSDTTNEAVLKAYSAGIVGGYGDGIFAPDATTTRQQIAAMIDRAITYIDATSGSDLAPNTGDLSAFSDADSVSDAFVASVANLAANGIMNGTSTTALSPTDPCTVQQCIVLVYRLYQLA